MSFAQNKIDYCNYNKIELPIVSNSAIEPVFNYDKASFLSAVSSEKDARYAEGLSYNYNISMLNTNALTDMMVDINTANSGVYPELGFLFVKSYLKQLLSFNASSVSLSPETFYKMFNKNQELVEIPYPIVLYLGGLYYFHTTAGATNIRSQDDDSLFRRINGVTGSTGEEIYSLLDLYRTPCRSKDPTQNVYFPSVRVLNRSLDVTGNNDFAIVVGVDENDNEILNTLNLDTKNIMPSFGYGIQNRFLNQYNKYFIGDYLNGSYSDDTNGLPYNDGKQHVISGAYCGITKPIKTYDSNLIEFTALYRNLYVNNFTYNISDMVAEFKTTTAGISLNNDPNTNKKNIVNAFVTYSKLKAMFMSNKLAGADLIDAITQLCAVKQIKAQYITDMLNTYGYLVPDFYYLLSHFFFASFKPEDGYPKFDFSFDKRLAFNTSDLTTYKLYQKSALTSNYNQMLNEGYAKGVTGCTTIIMTNSVSPSSKDVRIPTILAKFLSDTWSLEKYNMIDDYQTVDDNATYMLYPSAGGYNSPNGLIVGFNPNKALSLANDNTIYNGGQKLTFSAYSPKSLHDIGFGNITEYFIQEDRNYKMYTTSSSADNINAVIRDQEILMANSDQRVESYLIGTDFNNDNFFRETCFHNQTILKNTNKFLWFETTDYGDLLKLDLKIKPDGTTFYQEFVSGVNSVLFNGNTGYTQNYFKSNYFDVDLFDDYKLRTSSGYAEQFRFSNLLDSLDFEKLEEFKSLFLEFCNNDTTSQINDDTFNLKTLMMASSFVTYSDIEAVTDDKTTITLTPDQVNLALIGNSMFQYDFMAASTISKLMNIALTTAQNNNFIKVVNTFCSQNIAIANYSPMGSIAYDAGKTPSIMAHLFPFSADVLFSDAKGYADLITGYTATDKTITENDIARYLTRKILFADQSLAPYNPLTNNDSAIRQLNEMYMKNTLYTKVKLPVYINVDDLYLTIVKQFFQTLNIAYTDNLYKQLIKFIRSYTLNILNQLNILNTSLLPGNPIMSLSDFNAYFNQVQAPSTLDVSDLENITLVPGAVSDNTMVANPVINSQITKF